MTPLLNNKSDIRIFCLIGMITFLVACDMQTQPKSFPAKKMPYYPEPIPSPIPPFTFEPYRRIVRSTSNRECKKKDPFDRINFDCTISDKDYETIVQDLKILRQMTFVGSSAEKLQNILHISNFTGESLFQWMEDRIQFVLDATFENREVRDFYAKFFSEAFFRIYKDPCNNRSSRVWSSRNQLSTNRSGNVRE